MSGSFGCIDRPGAFAWTTSSDPPISFAAAPCLFPLVDTTAASTPVAARERPTPEWPDPSAVPDDAVHRNRLAWLTGPNNWQTEVVGRTNAAGVQTNCFFEQVFDIGSGDTPTPDDR